MFQVVLVSVVLFLTFLKAYGEEKLLDIGEPEKVSVEFRQDENPDNNTITVTTTVRGRPQGLPAGSGDGVSVERSRNAPVGLWGGPDSDSLADLYVEEKLLDTAEPEKASVEFRQDENPDNNTITVTTMVRGRPQPLPTGSGEE